MSDQMLLEPETGTDDNPQGLTFLPIDPFAARPVSASRIAGLGGEHADGDSSYAFQSLQVHPVLGPVTFTLTFHELVATSGTLCVRLHALSTYPGTAPMLLRTIKVDLASIAAAGGMIEIAFESRRNLMYTISGAIEGETDAQAHALSLGLSPRRRDTAPLGTEVVQPPQREPQVTRLTQQRQRPELITTRSGVLARPVSQAMTAAQCRDPLVKAWNATLGTSARTQVIEWQNAVLLQALAYYGVETAGATALGVSDVRHPLASYLAGRGCTVLAATIGRDNWPEGDPGLALATLHDPELSSVRMFFDNVHLTQFEELEVPAGLAGFDFLWSLDAGTGARARARFPQMLRDTMACLKPDGLAVHLLRYSGEIGTSAAYHAATVDTGSEHDAADHDRGSYCRAEIERMALSLIADGHEVAQLKFDVDPRQAPGDRAIPFILVARRIR